MAEGSQEALRMCLARGTREEAGSKESSGLGQESAEKARSLALALFLSVATGDQMDQDRHNLISAFILEPLANFREMAPIWESKLSSHCVLR